MRSIQILLLPAVGALLLMTRSAAADGAGVRTTLTANGGALVTGGLSEFTASGTGGFGVEWTWPLGRRLQLGLRLGLALTDIPYGSADGEPTIGEPGYSSPDLLEDRATFLPQLALVLRAELTEWLEFTAGVGAGWIASEPLGVRSLLPNPVASLGLGVALYREPAWGLWLRAGCDVEWLASYGPQPVLFMPHAALAATF